MSAMLLDAAALADLPLPTLPTEADKLARGRVFVVGGGPQVPGAPIFTGLAALRVGAGTLALAATRACAIALGIAVPEARIVGTFGEGDGELGLAALPALAPEAAKADSLIIGPGLMGARAPELAAHLAIAAAGPCLIDAAALPGLGEHAEALSQHRNLVLTPHAGEMAGLMQTSREAVEAAPPAHAMRAAERFQAVVALKGATTWIAAPDGGLWRHDGGATGLGAAGSGDVLAGVIGGFLARGADPLAATARGVFLHGLIGRRLAERIGPIGYLGRDILDGVTDALHAMPAP